LLGAYSSEPAILKQNDNLVFMTPARYDSYFKPWVDAEMKRFGKKLGLMPTTTAYGNAWKTGFSDAWKAAGGTVGGDYAIDYNTTADFSGAVTKALTEKPDVMLVGGPSQPTALVMKSARDQGFKGGFVMMDQAKFEQVSKVLPLARLDGTVGIVQVSRYGGPGTAQFIAAYDKTFGKEREVNSESAINYMAMHTMARAMTLANSVSDPVAIAEARRRREKSTEEPAGHCDPGRVQSRASRTRLVHRNGRQRLVQAHRSAGLTVKASLTVMVA